MHTIHRSRTAVSSLVAVLLLTLAAPIAVHGQDEDLAEEPVLAAQDQDPALVPVAPVTITAQVPADVRWAPSPASAPEPEEALRAVVAAALAWDESSGYGPVEASRAEAAALLAPEAGPSWDETSGYGSVEVSRAARAASSALPAPAAAPTLRDASATTQTAQLFTVTGAGFTAGGRVYLAIYDQMGAQLYETRWTTASLPLLAVIGPTGHEAASINGTGGTLREAFANLCGATAMMRAYDPATSTWSNWLTVEPTCTAYVEPSHGPR